jgi:hypothetical protein
MAACSERRPDLRHHVFTTVPRWFFDDSLPGVDLAHHRLECDVGMVQADAVTENVEGTVEALGSWLPWAEGAVDRLAATILDLDCRAVVADIAPLGLAAARAAGRPGILVENFTWDWIYRAYADPGLDGFGERLRGWFEMATLRIQVDPVCRPLAGAVRVPPVSRSTRVSRSDTRHRLGLREEDRVVLVGQGVAHSAGHRLQGLAVDRAALRFVVPDATVVEPARVGKVVRTPQSGGPYHPDLVAASDLVIAKLGYSTVAEVFQAGAAMAFLCRPRFPESGVLEAFVRGRLPSAALAPDWLDDPGSGAVLEDLARMPRPVTSGPNGADQAAGHILELLHLRP